MHAMTPVLERGYTFWDRSILPPDEFEDRTHQMQKALREDGLGAIVIWSQSYHSNGDLTYLSGWPMGGALVITQEGDPAMFCVGGGREQYFARMQTWLGDLRSFLSGLGKPIQETLVQRGVTAGKVGLVGLDQMPVNSHRNLTEALAGYELIDYGATYQARRSAKRPRELVAIGNSLRIAEAAVAGGEAVFAKGASNVEALVEAERIARILGARDFRALANLSARGLRPFDGLPHARQSSLALWVAVDQHAYWAEAANAGAGAMGTPARKAVDAMIAAATPGASADSIARAALSVIPAEAAADVLSYGLGSGIGLSRQETPLIEPGNVSQAVSEGLVLSLRAYVPAGGKHGASLATAMVCVGKHRLTLRGSAH
jgi:Xaa-Pro aminopeptidase